jgi:hypothetical protein
MMLWVGIKSYFACAWSAFTYIFTGMPKDKPSYWANKFGFADTSFPEYAQSVLAYKKDPSFHHLKDIGVEWTDAWPQRSFKVTALFGCLLALAAFLLGFALGGLVF